MASNKIIRFGPVALTTTTTTDLLNPALDSIAGPVGFTMTQPYLIIRHIRVVNKTASDVTFTLYLGATGANAPGTEVVGSGYTVAGNSAFDWYGAMRLDDADFLVGGASANTALTIQGEGEIGIA